MGALVAQVPDLKGCHGVLILKYQHLVGPASRQRKWRCSPAQPVINVTGAKSMFLSQVGLLHHAEGRTFDGYTLVPTFRGRSVSLVNMFGARIHGWTLPGRLGSLAYLLPGGNLLCSIVTQEGPPLRQAKGGHILELDWDGRIVWEHIDHSQHHDLRRLPNGNTLYIGWREMEADVAARVRGGIEGTEHEGKIYEDYFREVTPSGETAWEWATSSLPIENYPLAPGVRRAEFAHANTCAPTPGGDILVNFRNTDMMAILSRSENRLVWERREFAWGRPHDPQILPNGNIMFFANGAHDMLAPQTSSVIEFDPKSGEETWRYEADIPWHFYSHVMGGCQPLPNGNVLICQSAYGRIFEVTRSNNIVWDYVNPDFDSQFPRGRQKANCVFRAFRYAADSPELIGKVL